MIRSIRAFLVLQLVGAVLGLTASSAHAKDLYLTVTRDFSPSETPQVQVDFKSDIPMQFRVLAPLDQKGFIAEQVDLKRAWRAPKSRLNPARFLLRGFNWSLGRFAWLRRSLDPALREKLIQSLGGNSNPESPTALPAGPKKLISSPEQFKVVQEFWLHPNDQDEKSTWDVPGFTDDESIYGSTRSRMLAVPRLSPGFYVLQVVQGSLEGQVVLVVNDLFAQLQQSSNQAIVRVADRQGAPVSGASVELRSLQGKWFKSAKTDATGVVRLDGVSDNDLITVVQDASRGTAIIDSEFYPSTAVLPDLYLYTDRPMYRPGDQVSFRGLTRGEPSASEENTLEKALGALEKRLLALRRKIGFFKGQEVIVSVTDSSGQSVGAPEIRAQVGEFGTFEGQFTVPRDIEKSGPLRITARLGEAGDFQGEIRVKNYIKPEFMVKVSKSSDTIRAGTQVEADVSLERYAGGIPAVEKVRAELIRERVSTPEWIADAGMGEAGSGTFYGSNGNARGGQTSLLPVVVWSQSEIPVQEGRAKIEFEVTATMVKKDNYNYSYRLVVHANESEKYVQGSTLFYDLKSEVVTQARFVPLLVKPGDQAWLEIRSLSPAGAVLGDIKGKARVIRTDASGKEFQEGSLDVRTNAQGRARLDIPVKGPGRVSVEVSLKDRSGAENIGVAEVLAMAPDSKSAPVSVPELELLSQNSQARVGETARILALLPAGWAGTGREQGQIYITVAGGVIHEARVQKVQGTAAWIDVPVSEALGTQAHILVSYPGSRGWVEKRFSVLIPPVDSLLVVQVEPIQKEAFPGGEQEVNITVRTPDGKPVKGEVSLSVVDRKVLDLQPEFRPGVERFFYPPQALNLMSFQSSDFQAYGWGELIARQFRSNYGFAATKEAMSSALKEKDTAFWVARAQTDLNGKARLKFRLPANQTFWVTSVLVTDREGRVGEGRAEFRARMPLQFLVNHPRGMRPGERALVRVKLSNPKTEGLPAGTPIKYHLAAVAGVSLESAVAFEGTLKPGEEKELSSTVALSGGSAPGSVDSQARFSSELDLGTQRILFEHDMDVLPGRLSRTQRMRLEAGKPISWEQPATTQVQDAEIVAASGLSGTLLGSTEWMDRYPHGCVEQFTSKLVVLALASRFGKSNSALLSEAELKRYERAGELVAGSAASLKKYKKSWGFSWFPDGSEADPAMSMLVGLLLVSDPDVYRSVGQGITDEISTLSWRLSSQDFSMDSDTVETSQPLVPDAAKVFLSAVSRYLSARSSSLKSEEIRDWALNGVVSQLKQVASQAQGESNALARAFLVLAIREYGSKVIKEVGGTLPALESQVQADLARLLKDSSSGFSMDRGLALYWPSAPVGALAVMGSAVQGLLQKDSALFKKFKQALLGGFNGEMYGGTFQTAIALSFSGWLMDLEVKERKALAAGKVGIAETPRLIVDGAAVDATRVSLTPGIAGWSARLDPGLFGPGKHAVQVDAGSSGVAKLHLKLKQSVGIADLTALPGQFGLKRELYRMDPVTGTKTPLAGREIQARVGDLIYIEYSFDPRGDGDQSPILASVRGRYSPYFILQDILPSGLDMLDESAQYESAPFSLPLGRAEKIRRDVGGSSLKLQFNLENFKVASERVRLGVVARVVSSGDFTGGSAELENFYDEAGRSRTESVQWKFSVK